MEDKEDGLVIEIENLTGQVVLEVNINSEIRLLITEDLVSEIRLLITEDLVKRVQGTLGHHKILHHSRIMVHLELPR